MHTPSAFGRLVKLVAYGLLRLLYRVEVRGTMQPHERMLVIVNHQSFIDGILLGAFLPLWPTYLIHTTIANNWFFKLPLRLVGVRHAIADTSKPLAMKTLISLVEAGDPVVIFPEGRITMTGSQMKVYDGPAFVAAKTGCTVVPVHIEGPMYTMFSRMGGNFPRKWFPKITVTIQPGVSIPMPDAPLAKQRRRLASERMRRIMQQSAYASRERMTLWDALINASELYGRKRRVLEDINTNLNPISYRMIFKGSLALGRLASRISAEREIVGILMPNANATAYLLFGLAAFGRVPAMLNFTSGLLGIQNACRAAAIKTVLTSRAFVEKGKLEELIRGLTDVKVVYLEDLRPQFSLWDKLWLIGWALPNPRRIRPVSRPEDVAVVMFTSGSEGVPKGVALSHDGILANVAQIGAAYPFSCADKFMSALPLFHAFGITAGIVLPLLKGCHVVLYPSPLHYRVVPEFVYDHDCTVLFTTNTFLGKYAKVAHSYDFYKIRHLIVGAEKLTNEVRQLCFEKFGLRVLEGYGATECSPVIAVNTPLANRPGTVGEVLPGIETQITPVAGLDTGGLLHVRGDNLMLGYMKADQPGVIQPVTSELGPGWYNTGDVVLLQDDYATIQARLKRFAKVAGEMVSLELVERIAAEAQPNGNHAAASIPDTARGEAVVLFTEDSSLSRDRLKEAARRLGASEVALPRRVVPVDKIPLLANGKKDYRTLSKQLELEVSRDERQVLASNP